MRIHTYVYMHTSASHIHMHMHTCIHAYAQVREESIRGTGGSTWAIRFDDGAFEYTYTYAYVYTYIGTWAIRFDDGHPTTATYIHTYI